MEGSADEREQRFSDNKFLSAFLWLMTAAAYVILLLRGFHSTHQGYVGDDIQLYNGVHHLWSNRSFYAPGINAYPPATAWIYLPFSLLPWPVAHNLWFLISSGVCLPLLAIALYRQFGRDLPKLGLPLWLTGIFLSAPPYVIAFFGQIFWPMASALALAWLWAASPNPRLRWASGALYAVALTKPTIALPFLLYQLLRKPTRAAAMYGVLLTLVLTLATALCYHHPAQMVTEYRSTIHSLVISGSYNDTGFKNPRRAFLFNAGILFFDGIRWVNRGEQGIETLAESNIERILEIGFTLFSCTLLILHARRANTLQEQQVGADSSMSDSEQASVWRYADDWAFAALTMISMLVFYHAWTDFGMLFLPFIVVINALAHKPIRFKWNLVTMASIMSLILFVFARNHELFPGRTHLTRILLLILYFQVMFQMLPGRAKMRSEG